MGAHPTLDQPLYKLTPDPEHLAQSRYRSTHLKLGRDHGSLLGEALPLLNAGLAVGHAEDLHHRALLLAGVAVAHGVVARREDGPLRGDKTRQQYSRHSTHTKEMDRGILEQGSR